MRAFLFVLALLALAPESQARDRWTPEEANAWYSAQPWLLGSNYIPSSAINQLEMWQPDSFDAKRIDEELSWAQQIGMTTMRVFLHDLLWQQDARGFKQRIDSFLSIASKHGIRPIFVLFDSCWDPTPKLGPQHPPIPGVHNSGWVQSPGADELADPASYPKLRAYVEGVVGAFANDKRILAWDVWNEPDNHGPRDYETREAHGKFDLVAALLPQVFLWARGANPVQPLTSGVWDHDDWSPNANLNAVEHTQLAQSDVISFHDYNWPEKFKRRVAQLKQYGRPLICTEYMARGAGSTIDGTLPLGKAANVGMINWGFVQGKIQTYLPWDSWQRPYTLQQPQVWFHDLFYPDGKPYRSREMDILKTLSAAPKGNADLSALD
ncbi:MAG TPA: hypothetical protein VGI93_20510 [Steroidobacteraceae bacterium]|jgi:hypothetical protein